MCLPIQIRTTRISNKAHFDRYFNNNFVPLIKLGIISNLQFLNRETLLIATLNDGIFLYNLTNNTNKRLFLNDNNLPFYQNIALNNNNTSFLAKNNDFELIFYNLNDNSYLETDVTFLKSGVVNCVKFLLGDVFIVQTDNNVSLFEKGKHLQTIYQSKDVIIFYIKFLAN